MRLSARLFMLCAALLLIAAEVPPALTRNEAPVFDVSIEIAPGAYGSYQLLPRQTPDKYRCVVFIHDEPGSKRVWGPKPLVIGPGEVRQSTVEYAGFTATLTAKIADDLGSAKAAVTIKRGEQIISRHVSTVTLRKPDAS